MAFETDAPADKIDLAAVPIQNPAGDAGESGLGRQRCDQLAQPGRRKPHVVVDEGDPLESAGGESAVVALRETVIPVERNQAHARKSGADVLHRSITGAVVADDDFEPVTRIVEGKSRLQAPVDDVPAVEIEDDD